MLAMLALRAPVVVGFAAVALFPPATVRVVTTDGDEATRHCQHAYRDQGKTEVFHKRPSRKVWIFKLHLSDYRVRWQMSIPGPEPRLSEFRGDNTNFT
jgi:hypothetical protein